MSDIASRIRERMEALDLSFATVAHECGVSEQSIRNWCRDADRIWACRIASLARALQCSIAWLLGLSDRIGKPPADQA